MAIVSRSKVTAKETDTESDLANALANCYLLTSEYLFDKSCAIFNVYEGMYNITIQYTLSLYGCQ
jgi:hypothetical protein